MSLFLLAFPEPGTRNPVFPLIPELEEALVIESTSFSVNRRIAAIDIGSNSIHLIIAEIRPGQHLHIIDREKEMVRLAAGTLQTHHLSTRRMNVAIRVLQRFAELANAHQAHPILVTATSAVREAWNREDFLNRVKKETGLDIEIIPGVEEARLISLAVSEVTDFHQKRGLIIDIGGGSTEFILTRGKEPELLLSVKLGAVRLQEQFFAATKSGPPTREAIQATITHIRSSLARTVREIKQAGGFASVIGTSGTILALANAAAQTKTDRIEDRSPDYTPFSLNLSLAGLEILTKQLHKTSLKERRRLPGLDSRRADIIIAGGILLETILKELGAKELTTCDWSLREGIILNYLRENEPHVLEAQAQRESTSTHPSLFQLQNQESIRARSVLSVARRYEFEERHSHHTAYLARRLFDETQLLHKLGYVERELLEYAAILHDIGYHIAHNSHHKHAMYLIRHAELPGFHSHEVAILANIARYHRGSTPKSKHLEFMALTPFQREVVRKLSAILRIADGLDRRHLGVVSDVKVKLQGKKLQIDALASNACEIETWCAERNASMFESIFDVSIKVRGPQEKTLATEVQKAAIRI